MYLSGNFQSTPEKLKIIFKSTSSPIINAISIEGDIGVQMSNIAMRGSSGTSFGTVDFKSMSFMHKELNTKLIIMQFGGEFSAFLQRQQLGSWICLPI